ncbi:hypothetical protein [Variovorax sp. DT-64]|uniref:hypothetical protein n=1 Tax=Variovorax sp. DT-64 TaxID=3396160 RepID=UPI003F1C02CC
MVLPSLSHREWALLVFFAALLVTAFAGPALPPPELGGAPFADRRAWHGLPNAMDVLSNLPFAAVGIWGLLQLRRLDRAREAAPDAMAAPSAGPDNALDCARMFFAGLILTAAGSAFYHLDPEPLRLAADRAGMAAAFAGIVGVAVCDRVSSRAGRPAAWLTLAGGWLAVAASLETGNVLPWGLVQFGGMAVLLTLAFAKPIGSGIGFKPAWVIFLYGLAKLFELWDHAIFEATHELVSGHTLKHLAAALAALPVLHAVRVMGRQILRQDSGTAAMTA